MGMLNCDVVIPEVKGLESQKMTVGRHLLLNCKSDTSFDAFDLAKLSIKSASHDPITYKVFSIQKTATDQLTIDMTFYKAQEIQPTEFVLFDGVNEHQINASVIKVESVLQPTQDGKPPEPFGSIFPISQSIPLSYYIIVLGAVLLAGLYSFFKIKRLNYYRKLKEKLSAHDSPTDPDVQFYRTLRAAEKVSYPLGTLDHAFRLFCLRTYRIPMFDLADEKAIRYFKHNSPELKNVRLHLQKLLLELDELKLREPQLTFSDKSEFVKKLYRFVDQSRKVNS